MSGKLNWRRAQYRPTRAVSLVETLRLENETLAQRCRDLEAKVKKQASTEAEARKPHKQRRSEGQSSLQQRRSSDQRRSPDDRASHDLRVKYRDIIDGIERDIRDIATAKFFNTPEAVAAEVDRRLAGIEHTLHICAGVVRK